MRNLKHIILLLSFSSYAQSSDSYFSDNDNVFNNKLDEFESDLENTETNGGYHPEAPGPVPINDYLPLLAVAAVGLGFYYRKELNQITK
ncbi:hypothetical protein [Faecalibacter bovis]|uniref:Uncharacterized protein n=1 Tax=Faecalibacter bovis TaxID=2898187 RepID=A0ABX7XA89_9FLAO|nr:hypothetical protein [Faecalibacter bovis]QTV04803.1 hypothetical protein J9309_08280 [Faecalibacter bovis]